MAIQNSCNLSLGWRHNSGPLSDNQGVMGFKRFLEGGAFQEFTCKHPKQVNHTETYRYNELNQAADIPVESDGLFCKLQKGGRLEDESKNVVSLLTEKEVETSAPYSWVTSSSSEEDAGSGAAICSSFSLDGLEFYFPRKPFAQSDDTYSLSLYDSPAIQIPLGPNHQAELPVWDPLAVEKCRVVSDHVGHDCAEKFMGDCVIPMPDTRMPVQNGIRAGDGRKDCNCLDQGSARCVQQHVREARERLRVNLGPEKYVKLGFCDMGEDVSQLWTEEEERVFHEVVYSNSVSHGKNFWDHLSTVFPSRTKKEIVSYYFNVFMLRRRCVQNRSSFIDIDSDDDEWNISYWEHVECVREDDSASGSLINEDIEVNYEDDLPVGNCADNDRGDCKDGLHGSGARSADVFDPGYLVEPSNAKGWDDSFSLSPFRFNNDFISTGKMIEEIFGASPDSGSVL